VRARIVRSLISSYFDQARQVLLLPDICQPQHAEDSDTFDAQVVPVQTVLLLRCADFGNSPGKLCHPRYDSYSAQQVLLNKQQIWCGGAYLDCYPDFKRSHTTSKSRQRRYSLVPFMIGGQHDYLFFSNLGTEGGTFIYLFIMNFVQSTQT